MTRRPPDRTNRDRERAENSGAGERGKSTGAGEPGENAGAGERALG